MACPLVRNFLFTIAFVLNAMGLEFDEDLDELLNPKKMV